MSEQFNVIDEAGRLLCPCCGWPDYVDKPAYTHFGGVSGSGICACCLWEPGFDDDPLASADALSTPLQSVRKYRHKFWSNKVWRGRQSEKPEAWNPSAQIEALLKMAPYLK